MLDNGRISSVQLILILYLLESVTASIFLPARVAQLAGPDGWLPPVAASLYGLLVAAVVLALAGRFPSQVFTEYLPAIIGKIPGKLLAIVYALVFLHISALVLNEGTSLTHVIYLQLTPAVVIDVVWALIAVYGAYLGIEVITRQGQLVVPVIMASQVLFLILLARDIDLSNLRPVLENGLWPVINAGLPSAAWRGEIFLLLMLYPYLNRKGEAWPVALWYLGLVALAYVLFMVGMIGVFGAPVVAHLLFPYLSFVAYESVMSFIERLDSVFVVIWIGGVLIKLALLTHSSAIAAGNALGLKSYRPALIPIAVSMVIISRVLYGNYLQILNFLFRPWLIEALAVELVIPALILLIAVLRRKGSATAARAWDRTGDTPAASSVSTNLASDQT